MDFRQVRNLYASSRSWDTNSDTYHQYAAEFDEAVRQMREEAWDEALQHVWKLADPARSTELHNGERYVLVSTDINQATTENPYRKK